MVAFVDTSALLALSHRRDQSHRAAIGIAARHHDGGGRYVGSTLILGEFHSHLLYLRGPAAARSAVARLLADPAHDWRPVTAEIVREAGQTWLARFNDQRFSLADAVSLEIMARERLTHAFGFDRHFETAGFSLLR